MEDKGIKTPKNKKTPNSIKTTSTTTKRETKSKEKSAQPISEKEDIKTSVPKKLTTRKVSSTNKIESFAVKQPKIEKITTMVWSNKEENELEFNNKYANVECLLLYIVNIISTVGLLFFSIFYIYDYVLNINTFVPNDLFFRSSALVIIILSVIFLLFKTIPHFNSNLKVMKERKMTHQWIRDMLIPYGLTLFVFPFMAVEILPEIKDIINYKFVSGLFWGVIVYIIFMISASILLIICIVFETKTNFHTYQSKNDKKMLKLCLGYIITYFVSLISFFVILLNIRENPVVEQNTLITIGVLIVASLIMAFTNLFYYRAIHNLFIKHGLIKMEILPVVLMTFLSIVFIGIDLLTQYLNNQTIVFTTATIIVIISFILTLPATSLTSYTLYLYKEK